MSDNKININNQIGTQQKNRWWIWLILLILILLLGAGTYFYLKKRNPVDKTDTDVANDTPKIVSSVETWTKNPTQLLARTTSSDTHKLPRGGYRMFLMEQGGIKYTDSTDAKIFNQAVPTGVTEDPEKFISNPAVLQISSNSWIMIYEQAPMKKPGGIKSDDVTGPNNQRNLYLAVSFDGKTFSKSGLAVDSSNEDNYFASVPNLVMLSDGKIRMYYVSYGDRIASRTSSDNGKTWIKDDGIRKADMAVDPDVITKFANGKTKWVMYYTILEPSKNALFKASSSDGLTWSEGVKVLDKNNNSGMIVDPDVIELTDGSYQMFFGESESATGNINLYYAISSGEIFN